MLLIVFPPSAAKSAELEPIVPVMPQSSPEGVALVPEKTISVKDKVKLAFPDAPVMVRVAYAESRFDPSARNPGSTATGIFQILKGTWNAYGCTGSRTNADDNIRCARKIYEEEGTVPWNSSKPSWYS